MTTIVEPEGVSTLGTTRTKAGLACANMTAPDLSSEINATSSVEVTGLIYPAGWAPGGTTNKGTKPARLSSKSQKEQFNRTAYTLADLQYVHDPQGDIDDPVNAAKKLLVEGAAIYIWERTGFDADQDWAATDKTRTHHVRLGPQIPSGDRTDENGEYFITQAVIYIDDPVDGVVAA